MVGVSHANIYLSEDFEGSNFPMGWEQETSASDGGWLIGSSASLSSTYFTIPSNGSNGLIATNDDGCNCIKNNEFLKTASFDLSTATTPKLKYDYLYAGGTYGGVTESASLHISVDGGTTWAVLKTIEGDDPMWQTDIINLNNYTGESDVKIGFKYNDNGGWMFGFGLDNVSVYEPSENDASIQSLTMSNDGLSGTSVQVEGVVLNVGTNPITSFNVEWTSNNNTFSQTFSGLNLLPLQTMTFTHLEELSLQPGNNEIVVKTTTPNGFIDSNPTNDSKTVIVNGIVPAPSKKVVVEEGTGTWCGWCPRGAVFLDRMTQKYPNYFIGIAAHNGDPMRVTEYDNGLDFEGFPSMIRERNADVSTGSFAAIENAFLEAIQTPAPASPISDLTLDTIGRRMVITSSATFLSETMGDYRLAVILVEDSVTGTSSGFNQENYFAGGSEGQMAGYENLPNPVPAAQMVYDHVGRILVGGFGGVQGSLPNTTETGMTYTYTFDTVTVPTAYNLNNIHLVTLLLDPSGDIVNANSQTIEEILNPGEAASANYIFAQPLEVSFYPNPAQNYLNIELANKETATVNVFNISGQFIKSEVINNVNLMQLDVSDLSEGTYLIEVRTDNKFLAKTFNIVK